MQRDEQKRRADRGAKWENIYIPRVQSALPDSIPIRQPRQETLNGVCAWGGEGG